jgi:hypothetical protein
MGDVTVKRVEEIEHYQGPQGAIVLALGATPGRAYEPRR